VKVRFLLDENESPRLKAGLLRLNPTIDVLRVGDPGAPDLETSDSDILRYLEVAQRLLVSSNRKTMPAHVEAQLAGGGRFWGLLWVRRGTPLGLVARELLLIWEASEAEEWLDRQDWLPL
jgi:Domain of unknown function (DUF5615)